MNHIFYQTKTKYTNTGDALINHALIGALRSYGRIHANCSSDIPPDFLDALGILPEERIVSDSEFAFIKSVIRCAVQGRKTGEKAYVFSGPGDLYGGGRRLVVRNFVSALIFLVFRCAGVTIVRIGRSVGPISRLMAVSERVRCAFLSHYYVRDSRSLRRCREMGIRNVEWSPDLSWIYDPNHAQRINHTNTVMVNLRNSIFDDVDARFVEKTLEKCEELLTELDRCLDGKMKVLVAYQIAEDASFSRSVYERLRTKFTAEYVDHQMRLEELEDYYSMADFHISNRMHSLLTGYKYGSLPVALIDSENHIKISATLRDCDLEELIVDIYEDGSAERICTLAEKRVSLMHKLFGCEKEMQRKIADTLEHVFS